MLAQLGVNLPPRPASLQLKNVAAVMVTATLPAFAQPGQAIDVTVSSLGNAKSLRGGTLLMTPLKGADGQVYAMAQGNVLVGGAGASANGSKVQVNHLSVGRIRAGATVERAVPTTLGRRRLHLPRTRIRPISAPSRQIVEAINALRRPGTAVCRRRPRRAGARAGRAGPARGISRRDSRAWRSTRRRARRR